MKTFAVILTSAVTIGLGILTYKKLAETADSVTKTSNDYDATLLEIKKKLGIS